MEEATRELELPSSTTTSTHYTTTPSMEEEAAWADWSPLVDRERFSWLEEEHHNYIGGPVHSIRVETSVDLEVDEKTTISSEAEENSKGVRLVHLLLAAAKAMTPPSCSLDLAGVILLRVKELACPAGHSVMERLAAHFAVAMQCILDRGATAGCCIRKGVEPKHGEEAVAAFQLLQDMSPYVKFGHFTANQAILEAVADARRVHVVDFDIMEGVQWASFMQAFVSREGFPATPPPHLRITAVTRAAAAGRGRKSATTAYQTGRRLAAFAASLGQPFSFQQCRLGPNNEFQASAVKLVKGEAVVVNCMLHLPHASSSSAESVSSFLSGAALLDSRLMVLVEEEISPASRPGFVPRFMDSLHHYAALYDSLEAGFPLQSRARGLVERAIMGPRIAGSLERSFGAEEGEVSWGEWMGTNGFRPWSFSWFNHCQAKLLVGLFNDGYCVEELKPNKLVLGWKSRRFLSASVWVTSAASPTQSSQNSDFQECNTPTWSIT